MTLQNFEQRQPGHELKKGLDYFKAKRIIRLKEGDIGEWTADVRGRDPHKYKVEIRVDPIEEIEEIEISHTTCSCPVGKPFCKHVIAVLYALREEYEVPAPAEEAPGKLADISKIPDEELRIFLQRYVAVNEDFLKILTAYTSTKEENRERMLYEMHILSVAQSVTESYGMIEEDQVPIVMKAADSLLAKAEAALGQANFEQVIAITFAVAETMAELTPTMEQSSLHPDTSIVEAVDLLMKVAKAALPADLRARLFILVQKEFVRKKYDKLDVDVGWMELMVLIDPEKVAAWDKRITDKALADKGRKGRTDEEAEETNEDSEAQVLPEEWLELYEDKIREYRRRPPFVDMLKKFL